MADYELIETDGVPIKAWTRGVPRRGRGARRSSRTSRSCRSCSSRSRRCPTCTRASARRSAASIPTRGRDHPGGGRRRHRLRHDGGARPRSTRERPAGRRCSAMRAAIERAVPHGRTDNGGARRPRRVGRRCPRRGATAWKRARRRATSAIVEKHPQRRAAATTSSTSARSAPATTSSRSASTRRDRVWFMLHSGSRGVGNRIGTLLHRAGEAGHAPLRSSTCPTSDLAYLAGGHDALRRLRRGGRAGRRTTRRPTAS